MDYIKMSWALHRMVFSRTYFNSRQYEWFRKKHIDFLKSNHHSKRIDNWSEKMSKTAFKQWENNDIRRKKTSEKMKENWKTNRLKLTEHNRSISKKGAIAAKAKLSKNIEYEGSVYVGWLELKEKTGITKHLYKKYYLNGINPVDRIGANGPVSKQKGESV